MGYVGILVGRAASHGELEGGLELFIVFLQAVVRVVQHQFHQRRIDVVWLRKAVTVTPPDNEKH